MLDFPVPAGPYSKYPRFHGLPTRWKKFLPSRNASRSAFTECKSEGSMARVSKVDGCLKCTACHRCLPMDEDDLLFEYRSISLQYIYKKKTLSRVTVSCTSICIEGQREFIDAGNDLLTSVEGLAVRLSRWPVLALIFVGVLMNAVKVCRHHSVTVSFVHLQCVQSVVLAAAIAQLAPLDCMRPPDFGAIEGFHHTFPSCSGSSHNTAIRQPLNVWESKGYEFYIFECSRTVQGFWTRDIWMFKSAKAVDFTSIKCSRSLLNFKLPVHLTLQFGIPNFARTLGTV